MNNKRYIIISVLLISGILLYSAIFNMEKNNKLDTNKIVAYVNGKRTGDIPGKNDGYVVDKIECTNNATASWNSEIWGILITDLSDNDTRCSVYFKTETVSGFPFDPDGDGNGQEQRFTAPSNGTYKVEVWGAQGGDSLNNYKGGLGGYAVGTVSLNKNDVLYIYVGGAGSAPTAETCNYAGGYNGGGKSNSCEGFGINNVRAASGGGATHIAVESGLLSTFSSKQDKLVIVAGGGGGACHSNFASNNYYLSHGGSGGGFTGGSTSGSSYWQGVNHTIVTGGTQSQQSQVNQGQGGQAANVGTFGQGGQGSYATQAGGGGGYYGGNAGKNWAGGGGSGYIGSSRLLSSKGIIKHMACVSCTGIDSPNTKTDIVTCHDSTPTSDCAKDGNGYARITYLGN